MSADWDKILKGLPPESREAIARLGKHSEPIGGEVPSLEGQPSPTDRLREAIRPLVLDAMAELIPFVLRSSSLRLVPDDDGNFRIELGDPENFQPYRM